MTRAEAFALTQAHVAQLCEHFEAVQIFCTRHNSEQTETLHLGAGNWNARMGMVQEFIVKEQALSRREAIEGRDL